MALDSMIKEQDIQAIIENNRVSRILAKVTFLARQRAAVNYSQRYVIRDD